MRYEAPRYPTVIMEFQRSLILALFSGESCEEVRTEGYAKARELISESIRRIMADAVSVSDLAVSKVLRRPSRRTPGP
jgi:flagellar basal body-associated protein FliL